MRGVFVHQTTKRHFQEKKREHETAQYNRLPMRARRQIPALLNVAVPNAEFSDFHGAWNHCWLGEPFQQEQETTLIIKRHYTMVVTKLMKALKGRKRNKVAMEERCDINEGKLGHSLSSIQHLRDQKLIIIFIWQLLVPSCQSASTHLRHHQASYRRQKRMAWRGRRNRQEVDFRHLLDLRAVRSLDGLLLLASGQCCSLQSTTLIYSLLFQYLLPPLINSLLPPFNTFVCLIVCHLLPH